MIPAADAESARHITINRATDTVINLFIIEKYSLIYFFVDSVILLNNTTKFQ